MSIAPRTLFVFAALCSSVAAQKAVDTRDLAIDDGAWHALPVTGGRAALAALGVSDARERAAVMIELIRRLHFSPKPPTAVEAALSDLSEANADPIAAQTDA